MSLWTVLGDVVRDVPKNTLIERPSWMKQIPGDLLISELSIPGTHQSYCRRGVFESKEILTMIAKSTPWGMIGDSIYGKLREFAYTQDKNWSIEWQLRLGVRFFDFRIALGGQLGHGAMRSNGNFYSELETVVTFLKKWPSEFVIVSAKWEAEEFVPEAFRIVASQQPDNEGARNVQQLKETFGASRFWLERKMPTLNEARGKIVFLGRFSDNFPEGLDFTNFPTGCSGTFKYRVQDEFEPTKDVNVDVADKKYYHVQDFLYEAHAGPPYKPRQKDVMYFNFLSAYASDPIKSPSQHWSPCDVAWGKGSGGNGVNNRLERWFELTNPNWRMGVVIMDYVHAQIVSKVITHNPGHGATGSP